MSRHLAALGLVAALACASPALADASPRCDIARPMSWRLSIIDPEKDLAWLVEKGWTTNDGKSVAPRVTAIKDIKSSPFTDENPDAIGRKFCYAIVETDHGNFIYKFWYVDGTTASSIHAVEYRHLSDDLPGDITIATASPYLPDAETTANTIAGVAMEAPNCKFRSAAWGDKLKALLLATVQKDRPDMLEHIKRWFEPGAAGDYCEEIKASLAQADKIVAGARVWGNAYDRRD
jgi:hypothetical protein